MEQTDQAMLFGGFFHDFHDQLVGVAGSVGVGVNGGHFMLRRGYLVVFGFGEDTQAPQSFIQIPHIGRHPGANGAEIMIVQLLALGRGCAEESPSGETQVLPTGEVLFGNEEILLFRAHGGNDTFGAVISK